MLTTSSRRPSLSPELDRLVELFYQLEQCEPGETHKLLATYRRLFQDAASRLPPGRTHDELQAGIRARVRQLKAARKKQFPTIPPKA
jgi:hypothetical protein